MRSEKKWGSLIVHPFSRYEKKRNGIVRKDAQGTFSFPRGEEIVSINVPALVCGNTIRNKNTE